MTKRETSKHHLCLGNVVTVNEVKKLRIHLKFTTGDYITCKTKFEHTNKGSPQCKICYKENYTVCHIISTCEAFAIIREHFKEQSFEICQAVPGFSILRPQLNQHEVFTQFAQVHILHSVPVFYLSPSNIMTQNLL